MILRDQGVGRFTVAYRPAPWLSGALLCVAGATVVAHAVAAMRAPEEGSLAVLALDAVFVVAALAFASVWDEYAFDRPGGVVAHGLTLRLPLLGTRAQARRAEHRLSRIERVRVATARGSCLLQLEGDGVRLCLGEYASPAHAERDAREIARRLDLPLEPP